MTAEFDVARQEIEPKRQPAIEPGDGAEAGSGAAKEDGEKAGFEQKRIPLEGEELLRHGAEGKVEHPTAGERKSLESAKESQRAKSHASQGRAFQYLIRGSPPKHRGQRQVAHGTEICREASEKIAGGLDSTRSHEPEDLYGERGEGDRVNRRQQAEENPLRDGEARRFYARSKGEASDPVEQISMTRDEPVQCLGEEGDRARRFIQFFAAESFEYGSRAAGHRAVWAHKLHGFGESFSRDLGEARGGFLRGRVVNLARRKDLPIIDPNAAKSAFSVVDEERLGERFRRFSTLA